MKFSRFRTTKLQAKTLLTYYKDVLNDTFNLFFLSLLLFLIVVLPAKIRSSFVSTLFPVLIGGFLFVQIQKNRSFKRGETAVCVVTNFVCEASSAF